MPDREATAEQIARVEKLCEEHANCRLIRGAAMGDRDAVRIEMDGGGSVVYVHPLDFLEFLTVDRPTIDPNPVDVLEPIIREMARREGRTVDEESLRRARTFCEEKV